MKSLPILIAGFTLAILPGCTTVEEKPSTLETTTTTTEETTVRAPVVSETRTIRSY